MQFVDISYGQGDKYHEFDIYIPQHPILNPGQPPPLLVFFHGGAWRSEDKADHRDLARKLAASTHFPVAVPNYRLTPRNPTDDNHFRHPGHAQDVLQVLTFLLSWEGPPFIGRVYDPERLYLIGHSCSAHMLTSIFLDSSSVTPDLVPPTILSHTIKGIAMSEGIFDLDLLLTSFPEYRKLFIDPTFGSRESYALFSTTNFPLIYDDISWLIIHSKGDTLIDLSQSQAMYTHLSNLHRSHAGEQVRYIIDESDSDHDDILRTDEYVRVISDFVTSRP